MASRPVKLKLLPRSVMKAKSLMRLPTQILGSSGILVTRSAGTWTVAVDPANLPAVVGLVIGTDVQAYDADLQALASNSTNGLLARTGAGTVSSRTLTAPATGITVTNGDGVAGNPTLVLANDLAALEGLGSTGIAARTAADTWAQRTLTAPAAGLTITNPAGVAGDPTFALANDLSALEGLGSTGIAARTAADTWAQRTITGTAAEITITFGDGVSGNPTISIPAAVTFTGKTVTGGTFSAPTINGGTHTAITGLGIRSTGAAFDLTLATSEVLTAGRTLSFVLNDAARTLNYAGNFTTGGALTLPAVLQGDLIYGSASGVMSALNKDAVGSKFVKNSGTSNNPAWSALALTDLPTQAAYTFVVNNSGSAAAPTAVEISTMTTKASPAATDYIVLSDQAASGALKKATVSSVASAGSVSSIAGNTGAFTLSTGITNSTNDIRIALPYFSANLSASSGSITNATPTKIQFNTETADSNGWYDNATNFRFTPLLAGKYLVTVQVECDGGTSVSGAYAYIYKNGSPLAYSPGQQSMTAGNLFAVGCVTSLVSMNGTTDYIEGWGRINGTGTLTFNGGTAPIVTFIHAIFISP